MCHAFKYYWLKPLYKSKSQFNELSDIQLFEYICIEEENSEAYEVFVERFLPDLRKSCLKRCSKNKLDKHIGEQIAHDTLERVYKYKSFKKDKLRELNNRSSIMAYFYRISSNLFYDYHKKNDTTIVINRTYFDDIKDKSAQNTQGKQLYTIKENTERVLKKLNPKERAVIIKDIEYKKHHLHLPKDVNEDLADELGVKTATIRKIRERAIKKIKLAIDEINKGH